MDVRVKNNIDDWLKFFLKGVVETAENGVKAFEDILKLQKENEEKIKTLGSRSANALIVLTELYKSPVITASKISKITGITSASAYVLISKLEKLGILDEVTGGKRGRIYILRKYVDIFNR